MNTIAAIKDGDQLIFEQVFLQYHEKLYFYVLKRTQSTFIAEETTQLTFIKLWQYRSSLKEELDISVQLFRIARTTLIDILRKETHSNKISAKVLSLNSTTVSNNINETIAEKELQQKLHHAITQMPVVRRHVFELSRLNGLSYQEIASQLSLSVKTVENHIGLALKQLRHFLTLSLLFIFSLFC